ncbi:YciI family protein [Phytohabitans sp. ZYX-F-186]|uniref:YciI family protein n=1 Tax=Phytohabitans maris TaxID=3071409 RepID=A0ABU0ZB78_9ACTN|nr:YciI family protein [Phytohabitans sp. ZYX-F-186]MDQ7904324.1 YciI family protein [Phytohabitans sp. ZYX-F-186]
MKYILLIWEPDTDWQSAPKEHLDAALAEHGAFTRYLDGRGIEWSGGALSGQDTATTLRPGPDGPVPTDGPFIELKEGIGGYYVIDVPDHVTAVEVARHCPISSATEVRPIWG